MDLYHQTSYELSEVLTRRYSTSFSMSSRLFSRAVRPHIYAIYGMARIADEIVDTYKGGDQAEQLSAFQREVLLAIETGYSTNPIVMAFAVTAAKYKFPQAFIGDFFDSMRQDLTDTEYSQEAYERYIYGSAEVIGLMCLLVFVNGDRVLYDACRGGAQALGAAYQKINFLRDMRDDYQRLGRVYFPGVEFLEFSERDKAAIEEDIERDLAAAKASLKILPQTARRAVRVSYEYYSALFKKLRRASVEDIQSRRVRVSDFKKAVLLVKAWAV